MYRKNTKITKMLPVLAKEICICLTDYINSSISNGQFPFKLKKAGVIPYFK